MAANLQKRTLTWKQLQAMQYAFNHPFQLEMEDGELLSVEEVVRIVPKRRMVVFATWKEKPVVAKLFFDVKHANRHVSKETAGLKILHESKIPTPALFYNGKTKDKRIQVLLFERIYHAQTLDEIWRQTADIESMMPQLQAIIIELATQHVLGVLQKDLHLKNFLLTEKVIYTLDGAQIEQSPQLLNKKDSMENLALFLSQLGVGLTAYQQQLFLHYANARGWLLKPEDSQNLLLQIKQFDDKRWQQYKKKIFRDCTDFVSVRHWNSFGMYDRNYHHPEFIKFLQQPEIAFNHATTRVIKAGRSSTVVRVMFDQQQFMVKRYNLKSLWHRLRRIFRSTRAVKSWYFAHKLGLFHVATPKPAACIEQRWLGLRGKSYFVTAYQEGIPANQWFKENKANEEGTNNLVTRITTLLRKLAKLEMTHGDLKITNIIVNAEDQPLLLDFDGAKEHVALSSLRRSWRKETKRFLMNFIEQPELLQKFREKLRGGE